MKIFDRKIELTVGSFEVSNLDAAFNVKKTLKQEPNTCEIKIWNMSADHRAELEKLTKVPVRLRAGYGDDLEQIYFGELRSAHTAIDRDDAITEITSGDGESAMKARIQVTKGAKTQPDVAFRAIAEALGVKPGNLDVALAKLRAKGIVNLGNRTVLSGNAAQRMTDFCESAELEWSVQDGELLILDRAKAQEGQVVFLSPETGLVGSPGVTNEGKLTAKAFLIPGLRPGRVVVIDSAGVKGGYRIEECEYTGSRHEEEFYVTLTGKRY